MTFCARMLGKFDNLIYNDESLGGVRGIFYTKSLEWKCKAVLCISLDTGVSTSEGFLLIFLTRHAFSIYDNKSIA